MSNATAPPPSLTCPDWCTDHQSSGYPDDEAHWTELSLPLFAALGLDPRVTLSKYVSDAAPTLMLDLTISGDQTLGSPREAAERFQGISDAFADLAVTAASMTPGREE